MTNKKIVHRLIDPQILELVDHHGANQEAILEILTDVQRQRGHLEPGTITDIARCLHLPAHKVYGIASFYSMMALDSRPDSLIRVCDGPVCWLCGADDVRKSIDFTYGNQIDWKVERTSCLGLCDRAPALLVNEDQVGPTSVDDVKALQSGWRGISADYTTSLPGELRVMLANVGKIDPNSLESALAHGAYQGLGNALQLSPEAVITKVEASGLTGRGGAGFPVGRKWRFTAQAQNNPKYVVCNADESEPLIFKDRVLINTNPHQILEGMAIAGYAIGAHEAFIYIRGEYVKQAIQLERSISQAESAGWLGDNIQGTGFTFRILVHKGAGAYICGEETGLIESLEGKRGEPRTRPPYPPTAGYHNLPTLVNNVESYAAVPSIMINGAEWYRNLSAASTPGTKLYMVLGHVKRPVLFEAPFGLTLRQIIDVFGGGMRPGSSFKFALAGGAAGLFVPAELLDIPIDYASAAKGVSLGAGAFLICDQSVSPVMLLSKLLYFFKIESCGKCTPCRVGTHRSYEILHRMTSGKGQPGNVQELYELADNMHDASFCGLGQSVPMPMRSALKYFINEFTDLEKPENFPPF
jgi:NADH:ubiquinone oxidoreductase subunit F (NADH-binding)/NADH:ubiquinone oxidoreductase subunit E